MPTASSNEGKASQESLVKLRKRNADLMTLTKKLDERCTALKAENEQLVSPTANNVAIVTDVFADTA